MLRLSFLGTFQAALPDRSSLRFSTNKVRALLAYLALEAGRPYERATLVGLLWPEMPEAKAFNNLSKALGLLHQALHDSHRPTPYLLIDRRTVTFNQHSDFWLDVAEFQRGVTMHAGVPQLEQAVALYRGEFLSGFSLRSTPAFEEWLLLWRERLQRQMLAALERLAHDYLALENYEQAQLHARRQLKLDPWREAAYVQMMQALALAGERGAALAQYEMCRRLLAVELGVEPAAETTALYESIMAGRLATSASLRLQPIGHNLPSLPADFVGRQRELTVLEKLIHHDQRRLVTVVGPGNIGKTRFVRAYVERYVPASSVSHFPDGVYFISLLNLNLSSDTPVAEQVVLIIAAAIKLPLETGNEAIVRTPKQQLIDYLHQKQLMLLLDNFDNLVASLGNQKREVEAVVAEILLAAPQVWLIVISRGNHSLP